MPQGKSSMLAQAVEEDGFTHLRQRGMSAPDSWLNFRCTLSSCLVRTSSWGMMAAELSLSKLSLRLLREQAKCTNSGFQYWVLFWMQILNDAGKNCNEDKDTFEFSPLLKRYNFLQTTSPSMQLFTLIWPRIWIDAYNTWCILSKYKKINLERTAAKLKFPQLQIL